MDTAKYLCSWLNYMKPSDEQHIDDLIWQGYQYEKFNKEDLNKIMQLLVPTNGFVIFQS